jgi:urease accessory protein
VGGDRLLLEVELEAGSEALLTTAAAAKIYGSRDQSCLHPEGQVAEQHVHIFLGPDSHLEWLPQETILFEGCLFLQHLRVDLTPGATFLSWDITRLGRTARGERFLRGDWKALTEVWQGDRPPGTGQASRPLWIDPQWIAGNPELWHSHHGLAGQPLIASLLWLGREISPELLQALRQSWTGTGEAGVSRLQLGVICRWRGQSTAEVQHWFRAVWDLLRREFRGRPACPPRAWMIY